MATVPTYTGTVPNRSQTQVNFDANVQDLLDFIGGVTSGDFVPSINTVAGEVDADKETTLGYKNDAAASATTAENAKDLSLASANFKGAWSDLTGPLSVPSSVSHNNQFWVLQGDLADVTASEPGVTSDWVSFAFLEEYQEFLSSGTFTKSPNAHWVYVEAVGGGGGGGGRTYSPGGGGGGGAFANKLMIASTLNTTESVTVGAGGAGQTDSAVASQGGSSMFGGHLVATGGYGGHYDSSGGYGGDGGGGERGAISFATSYTAYDRGGGGYSSGGGGAGDLLPGSCVMGGAGGGGGSNSTVMIGGVSQDGGDGGDGGDETGAVLPTNGAVPGGGGGGGAETQLGADGADGRVRIWQW